MVIPNAYKSILMIPIAMEIHSNNFKNNVYSLKMENFFRKIRLPPYLFIFFLTIQIFPADTGAENSENSPNINDLVLLASIGFLTAGMEFGKEYIGPFEPRFTTPGSFDDSIRTALVWNSEDHGAAALNSDIFLGILASQIVLAPFFANQSYWSGVMMFSESFIYTAFFTNLIKILAARQRPYAYYGDGSSNPEDNSSFVSGHTSLAFALATTGSIFFGAKFPKFKAIIYPIAFILASATGYMRIAADVHYMTDVLGGAILGTTMGWIVYENRKKWIKLYPNASGLTAQMTFFF